MEDKYKVQFELLNNSLWMLIKSYISDDKPYKKIMSELFNIYIEKDKSFDSESDLWWDSLRELYNCPDKYRGNKDICGFGADLADDFHELFKLKAKRDISNLDFYRVISPAFIHEWERLKNAKKHEKKTTG